MSPRKSFKFDDSIFLRSFEIRMSLKRVLLVCHLTVLLHGLSSGQHHHVIPEPSSSVKIKNGIGIGHDESLGNTFASLERKNAFLTRKDQGNLVQAGKGAYQNQDDGKHKYLAVNVAGNQHQKAKFNDKGLFKEYSGRKGGQAAKKSGNTRSGESISSSKKLGGKSGESSTSSKHKLHKKDYILSDKIHYGFDKTFNKEEEHDGVYKSSKHKDDHILEKFNDKHRDFKDMNKAKKSAEREIGSQRALRDSSKRAGSGSYAFKKGGYYDNQNKKKQAGSHNDVYGSRLDYSAGGDRFSDKRKGGYSKTNQDASFANRKFGKRNQEMQLGGAALFGSNNNGDATHLLAGKNAERLRAGVSTFGHSAGAAEGHGSGFSKLLSKGKEGFNSGSRKGFNTRNNKRGHREGRYNQGKSHSDHVENHRSDKASGKNKNAAEHQYADASKYHKNSDESRSKLKTVRESRNSKKKLIDRVSNDKQTKVFHTSKKVKGDNYELLDFDRKKFEKDRVKDDFDQSADGKKYNSKFRVVDNKGKRYSGMNASRGHNFGYGGIKKAGHAIATQRKNTAGNRHLKTNKGGKYTFDHRQKGKGGFGYKAAQAKNKDYGSKQVLQNAEFAMPKYGGFKHPVVEYPTISHPRVSRRFPANDFSKHYFGVPSRQYGNPFSRFHNPFESMEFDGKVTNDFHGNSNKIPHIGLGSPKKNALSKPRIPVISPAKQLESNHRFREITKPSPSHPYNHQENLHRAPSHPNKKVYGNYKSMSMSNLFSGSVFGSDISDSFPSFDEFF